MKGPKGPFEYNMIEKKHRIDTETLKKVIKTGKNSHSEHFFVKILPNTLEISRFSVIISKKTSKLSVGRHLLKRQISDIIEKMSYKTRSKADFAIFSKENADGLEYENVKKEIGELIF